MPIRRDISKGGEAGRSPLASGSIHEHLIRGAGGLLAAVLAVACVGSVGPMSLALLALTAFAWRGCPTCWTVGLLGTLADDRAHGGGCATGNCRPAGRDARLWSDS
jgi:hypothetical protein